MKSKDKVSTKIANRIIASIAIIATILIACAVKSSAMYVFRNGYYDVPMQDGSTAKWNGNFEAFNQEQMMPSFNGLNNPTGMFPQAFPGRSTGDLQQAGGTIFCADQGKMVRSDLSSRAKIPSHGQGTCSIDDAIKILKNILINKAKTKHSNISNVILTDYKIVGKIDDVEEGFEVVNPDEYHTKEEFEKRVAQKSKEMEEDLQDQIAKAIGNDSYSSDISGIDETSDEASFAEYVMDGQYKYKQNEQGINEKNNKLAYVLSTHESYRYYRETYDYEHIRDSFKYTSLDEQTAYWMLYDPDGVNSLATNHLTQKGKQLADEAKDYEKFLEEFNAVNTEGISEDSYKQKANFENVKAQVMVNAKNKKYIVGPFKINYPDYTDVSYINGLTITKYKDGKQVGETLEHSEKIVKTGDGDYDYTTETHNDFSIICQKPATASNGLRLQYPAANTYFYVEIPAGDVAFDSITLGANFEYLKSCSITTDSLEAVVNAKIHKAIVNDGHLIGKIEYKADGQTYTEEITEDDVKSDDYEGLKLLQAKTYNGGGEGKSNAQPLTHSSKEKREYANCEITTTIDYGFRIKLGGKVWCDAKAGKESKYNGQYDSKEELMSGIKVTLYQQGKTDKVAETYTTAEYIKNNGNKNEYSKDTYPCNYLFEDLDPFGRYRVEFTYNGQYYQPTTYKAEGVSWDDSSKGLEKINERKSFNKKFEEIKSSPNNYKNGKVYSREYLSEKGYIDKYGNITQEGKNSEAASFIEDCMITSYTTNGKYTRINFRFQYQYYPTEWYFTSSDTISSDNDLASKICANLGENAVKLTYYVRPENCLYSGEGNILSINQGLVLRERADLALKKDVFNAVVTINGKTETYKYNKRDANQDGCWEIRARESDAYYNTSYTREVYKEDYNAVENKDNPQGLDVYVTYRLTIRNQSETLKTSVTEVVDYYDKEYEFVRAYLGDRQGNENAEVRINANSTSRYRGTEKNIEGYNRVYLTGMEKLQKDSDNDKDMYIYVTFKVNRDSNNKIILDDNDAGKANIAEINGYKTYYGDNAHSQNEGNKKTNVQEYKPGDSAGLIDEDSTPGNLTTSDPKDFEDDTDKAPNIKVILNKDPRQVSGYVWEDARTETVENSRIGNGKKDNGEQGAKGVTVELVDANGNVAKVYDGTQWKDAKTITTSDDGKYTISGFIPGNYYVRFVYGKADESGKEDSDQAVKYNGQDYKATIYNYQPEFDYNNPDNPESQFDLKILDNANQSGNIVSNAKDVWGDKNTPGTREYVNYYCNGKESGNVQNALANQLNTRNSKEFKDNVYMNAETPNMVAEIEYDRQESNTNDNGGSNIGESNYDKSGHYVVPVSFGLQERAKAQLKVTKEVENVQVTLANGSILFDASGRATNVLWQGHKAHGPDKENTYKENDNYKDKLLRQPEVRTNSTEKGKIQLTMDEELMHGANLKVTYKISIANIGEVDYKDKEFYYLGKESNAGTNIVYTKSNSIIDYVGFKAGDGNNLTRNNLQFYAKDNDTAWKVVSVDDLVNQGIIDKNLTDKAKLYTTIIKQDFDKELKPILVDADKNKANSVITTKLVLTQTLTADSKNDDKSYDNITELVSTSNTVGRRMAYSVVGNQDPTAEPAEIDADDAQTVTILPPFGQKNIYYVLGAAIAVILIAGVVVTIRVIKKK